MPTTIRRTLFATFRHAQRGAMIDRMDTTMGMIMMTGMGIIGVLAIIALILAILALIKYLRAGRK